MIGMVLAAGAGSRLGDETADLPKTLLGVDGDRTILDIALGNFAQVGLSDAVIVTGHAHDRLAERVPGLERATASSSSSSTTTRRSSGTTATRCGWRARRSPRACCSPTATPCTRLRSRSRCSPPAAPELLIAVDDVKPLGAEEMKVHVTADGYLDRINKALDPATAQGEYIGVTLIEPAAAGPLADALEATWRRDTTLYYEDGFQELADRGGRVGIAPIGAVEWVEVDDHVDLARAREVACRC